MVFFLLIACATKPTLSEAGSVEAPVPSATPQESVATEKMEVLATRDLQGARAVFWGEKLPEGLDARFGIRQIRFEIDGSELLFSPSGTIEDSDWSFEIATAEGDWVVLPQDHYGPYHVISTAHLGEYLSGGKPAH